MSYIRFLEVFGMHARPTCDDAYSVWDFDEVGPPDYLDAMRWMHHAMFAPSEHEWCRHVWRAKVAWARYLSMHQFPLPMAEVRPC